MADHVCPVWVGYLLLSPLRRLLQNPRAILGPHVHEGDTVLDIGCAMGFFSLPTARLVGPAGRVICLDLQQRMLSALERRARRTGLVGRIETRTCGPDTLGIGDLAGRVDFVLAFAVVHEVPDAGRFFAEACAALKPGGRLLLAEPVNRVAPEAFEATVAVAARHGLKEIERPRIRRARAAILCTEWTIRLP